jgi:hypothetical protein
MGNKFGEINRSPGSIICPTQLVDLKQVGSVYFVQKKPKSENLKNEIETKDNETEKITYYSLAIDITGTLK